MISKATLGRIPAYLKYLRTLPSSVETISATTLARALNLGEVQVRKDLASVCGTGKPKVGYLSADLIRSMDRVLSGKSQKEAIIVGAGKLGAALLSYHGFSEYGITIAKAFDVDADKCGKNVLLVNPFCAGSQSPESAAGACVHFRDGVIVQEHPSGKPGVLPVFL